MMRWIRSRGTLYYHRGWYRSYPLLSLLFSLFSIASGDRAMLSVSIKRSHPQSTPWYNRNFCIRVLSALCIREIPARVALVALPRSNNSLSWKLRKFATSSKRARVRQRSAAARQDFIKSPRQQILLISACFPSSYNTDRIRGSLSWRYTRILFHLILHS